MQRVLGALKQYEEELVDNPFHIAPRERINGPVLLAHQERDNAPVGITPVELCSNLAVIGSTGSGKTAFLEHVLNNLNTTSPETQVCYYDPKRDWLARATRQQDTIIVDDTIPLNILIHPAFLSREAYHALLVRKFCDAYYGGFHMHHILTAALNDAVTKHPDGPNMHHLIEAIQALGGKSSTYQFRDAQLNALTRIRDLCTTFPGIATAATPRCHTMQTLMTRPAYFGSKSRLHAYEFLFTFWTELRHTYHQSQGIRDELHTFVVGDETLQLFDANTRHITGEPLLSHTYGATREAGIGWGITLTSWRSANQIIRANTNLQAVLRVTDGTESEELRRTLRLTPAQHECLDHQLQRGQVILRLGNRYPEPLLATYPAPTSNKEVATEELAAARDRAEALLPPAPLSPSVTTEEAPSETETSASRKIALNAAQEALLRHVCNASIATVKKSYEACNLKAQIGDRAKRQLLRLKLLTATPITAHRRTGGRAIALQATDAGYERVGSKRPPGTRGGDGAQHRYLVKRLHQLIPESDIEVTVGTKSVDLLFTRTEKNDQFFTALREAARSHPTEDIPVGSVVALEVEVSDPARTGANNANKNASAGIPCTILAIFEGNSDLIIDLGDSLDDDARHHLILVDVLDLIEELTTTK
ncbi:MAG TPA: hypothetical protein VGN17_04965 [Bryobacteraceae bacterium]|jgi:hypothetical protein